MKIRVWVAALGGALIGAALSRQFPLVTVIVNVANQGSIDIKVENGTPPPQIPKTLNVISESAPESSNAANQPTEGDLDPTTD